MIVYWGMFAFPALLGALLFRGDRRYAVGSVAVILIAFFFLMAFRQTGGDFYTYNLFYELLDGSSFAVVTSSSTDFLYGMVNWISMQFDWGINGVNAICAVIFLVAFFMFARHEPFPLLTLAVATAYFIIVVAIGYTRQGVAAGLLLWGTVYLRRKEPWKYMVLQILAVGFHTSSALAVFLVYFALKIENRLLKQIVFAVLFGIFVAAVLSLQLDTLDRYVSSYVESERYSSDGAITRIAMSFVAAILFLIIRKSWPESDRNIWASYSWLTLALLPVLLISSTIADRLGLYTIALQVAVFGRLPMFGQTAVTRTLIFAGVLGIYALVLGVWLNVGNFARVLWLPYSSSLLGVIP